MDRSIEWLYQYYIDILKLKLGPYFFWWKEKLQNKWTRPSKDSSRLEWTDLARQSAIELSSQGICCFTMSKIWKILLTIAEIEFPEEPY